MFAQALFKIGGYTDVALAGGGQALDQIDVDRKQPSSAEASKGILRRPPDFQLQLSDGHQDASPAKPRKGEAGWQG